jgi:dipeptidyl aminopeptidase/acylaminoacyl peptidase
MNNLFLFGWSRGGMMTLLALKNNLPVNAAAVGGALADLTSQKEQRQGMVENVYKQLIPDFDKRGEELRRERSAVYWPEKVDVPLLILQGGADWRVDPGTNALALAQKLQELGKTFELIIYAGDDHGLSFNGADGDKRTIAWFKRYMK